MGPHRTALGLVAALCFVTSGTARQQSPRQPAPPAVPWVESDFPFFSSVLDAGHAGGGLPAANLTPRALVLNLGDGLWAAFDTDLLRVAAMWRGNGITPKALAPGSYHAPDKKTPGGQAPAPAPDGLVWIANGIYPGWQTGDRVSLADPRSPAPSPEEVGRGPIPEAMGRFNALRIQSDRATLEYAVGGVSVSETVEATEHDGRPAIARRFRIAPSKTTLVLTVGASNDGVAVALDAVSGAAVTIETSPQPPGGSASPAISMVKVAPHATPRLLVARRPLLALGPPRGALAVTRPWRAPAASRPAAAPSVLSRQVGTPPHTR